MEDAYLGLDVATQGIKGIVVNGQGQVLFTAAAGYPTHSLHSGWMEQDPHDWKRGLDSVLAEVAAAHLPVRWRGIGITGQMHTTVVTNGKGEPLRPAILWSDQRVSTYARSLEHTSGLDSLMSLTGNKPFANYSGLRLLWLRDEEPETYHQIRHLSVAKDWVRWLLTGTWGTDVTDASGTYLFNVAERRWEPSLVSTLAADPSWLGTVTESSTVVGSMQYGPEIFLGLPVVAGAGDQAASALGTGLKTGDLGISLGTSGVLFWELDQYLTPPDVSVNVFCHARNQSWHWMTVTQAAALSVRWFRDQFYPGQAFSAIDMAAQRSVAGSHGLLFLPFLVGERAPLLNSQATGGFFGVRIGHELIDFARAVLEGVAYSFQHCVVTMNRTGDIRPKRLVLTGGGAQSAVWTQIIADVLGQPITVTESHGAAAGAALLACLGITGQEIPIGSAPLVVVKPNPERHQLYQERFNTYLSVIGGLTPSWTSQ